jgi:hypothetical protein
MDGSAGMMSVDAAVGAMNGMGMTAYEYYGVPAQHATHMMMMHGGSGVGPSSAEYDYNAAHQMMMMQQQQQHLDARAKEFVYSPPTGGSQKQQRNPYESGHRR